MNLYVKRKGGYTLTAGNITGSNTSGSAFTWSQGDDIDEERNLNNVE